MSEGKECRQLFTQGNSAARQERGQCLPMPATCVPKATLMGQRRLQVAITRGVVPRLDTCVAKAALPRHVANQKHADADELTRRLQAA